MNDCWDFCIHSTSVFPNVAVSPLSLRRCDGGHIAGPYKKASITTADTMGKWE